MALVLKLLEMYKTYAKRFTDRENHAHQSNHASSLSTKVFALSVMNGHLGLALSAFVKGGKKKHVAFEDEPTGQGQDAPSKEERELPEYEDFEDYGEMVTQIGYVALWSTLWPLAPVIVLLNNYIEARSDAFKIVVHTRRPIPVRTDTIGPWLASLSFLTWLSALPNSALVYHLRPPDHVYGEMATAMNMKDDRLPEHSGYNGIAATKELLVSAPLIALLA
ncbi:hypothetical protein HYDPIDRAFT_33812 [Hydnomerulius pinastri MD-312]|uniref:Unplaced genomic scaffold scaffold_76, whole genome shotgun sequence n=1 Tax=Hydnomerulius pinastri MD-312 TaxID=994086 RepID=A0A0C9V0N0_9AGAM|nr:hypothetical protein HYDPIDRAFT_33812 [Hydnomerulius pinastri MD-312]